MRSESILAFSTAGLVSCALFYLLAHHGGGRQILVYAGESHTPLYEWAANF